MDAERIASCATEVSGMSEAMANRSWRHFGAMVGLLALATNAWSACFRGKRDQDDQDADVPSWFPRKEPGAKIGGHVLVNRIPGVATVHLRLALPEGGFW